MIIGRDLDMPAPTVADIYGAVEYAASIIRGRPPEVRKAFAKAVTEAAVETLDVPIETVRVIITEVEPENWSIGGKPKGDP